MTTGTSHVLNSTEGHLEVFSEGQNKIQIKAGLTSEKCVNVFSVADTWINTQPAQYVRVFKTQIINDNGVFRAQINEGKLHLFSDSFASFNINVEHEGHKHSFRVSPTLSLKGLHVLIEEKLKCSDFTICTTTSEQPLSESYTLEACGITETTSLMVIIDTVPDPLIRRKWWQQLS